MKVTCSTRHPHLLAILFRCSFASKWDEVGPCIYQIYLHSKQDVWSMIRGQKTTRVYKWYKFDGLIQPKNVGPNHLNTRFIVDASSTLITFLHFSWVWQCVSQWLTYLVETSSTFKSVNWCDSTTQWNRTYDSSQAHLQTVDPFWTQTSTNSLVEQTFNPQLSAFPNLIAEHVFLQNDALKTMEFENNKDLFESNWDWILKCH